MDYEVQQLSIDQICRLCASTSTSMDFDLSSKPSASPPGLILATKDLKLQNLCYFEIVEIVLQVKLDEDGPNGLCESCARKLIDFYEFKVQFEISQTELRGRFGFSDVIPKKEILELFLEDKSPVLYELKNEDSIEKFETNCLENNEIIEPRVHGQSSNESFSVNEELYDTNEYIEIMSFDANIANNCDNDLIILDESVESSNNDFQFIKKKELLPNDEFVEQQKNLTILTKKKFKEIDKKCIVKFQCKICNKEFSSRSVELAHQTVHTEKQFECNVCHKKFTRVYHLKSHFSTIHLGINKRYTCEKCGRCFTKISDLNRHMRIHSDKALFQCSMCPKEFKWKSSYVVHLASHTGLKQFECSKCNNAYTSGCSLKKHQVKHNHL